MTQKEKIADLARRMEANVRGNILPFWKEKVADDIHGGFFGKVNADLTPDLTSPKSVVLNCRLLWTYTKAWELMGDEECRELANRAFTYLRDKFWDPIYSGVYWMVTCKGEPSEVEKRTYGQAFIIYSMAEYYKAFGNKHALDMAMSTLRLMNEHMLYENGGYADSATRDWLPDEWVNIWVKNRGGAAKLLNSNMHLFEAILTLAEAAKDEYVLKTLRRQLEFILHTVMDRNLHHLKAGMDKDGNRIDNEINYGHDAECSYLLVEAAELLGDGALIDEARAAAVDIVEHIYSEGLDPINGGVYYITDCISGETNRSKIWWVEAEGVTAMFNCFQLTGNEKYLDAARSIWNYIENNMVNHESGDWYAVGTNPHSDPALRAQEEALRAVFNNGEMAGKGKCPYHNSRTCFEIMARSAEYIK